MEIFSLLITNREITIFPAGLLVSRPRLYLEEYRIRKEITFYVFPRRCHGGDGSHGIASPCFDFLSLATCVDWAVSDRTGDAR